MVSPSILGAKKREREVVVQGPEKENLLQVLASSLVKFTEMGLRRERAAAGEKANSRLTEAEWRKEGEV